MKDMVIRKFYRKNCDYRFSFSMGGVLVRYRGSGGKVVIPAGVTGIGYQAFSGPECGEITSIMVPASVRFVAEEAFDGCTGLTRLILPDSVTSIGDLLFGFCSNLPLREFQADGIPTVEMLDHDWDQCDVVLFRTWAEELAYWLWDRILAIVRSPAGFSMNRDLVGPLLRNFARRYLSGEEIPAEIARSRMRYLRRKMSERYSPQQEHSRSDILWEAARFADSPELLQLLFQDGLVKREDVSFLMDAAGGRKGNAAMHSSMQSLIWEYTLRYLPNAEPVVYD